MATQDLTSGAAVAPHSGLDRGYVLENLIDLSVNNSAASDVLQALKIPAWTKVTHVMTRLIVAEGGTLTAEVGDGADPNGWDASVDLNAAAGTATEGLNGTDAYMANPGKIYTAEDTIDLTMSANAGDTAKILVQAICYDLNPRQPSAVAAIAAAA